MRFDTLAAFLQAPPADFAQGPSAMIFAEDEVEIDGTLRHHRAAGFAAVALFAPPDFRLARDLEPVVHRVDYDLARGGSLPEAVTAVAAAVPGAWLYYCYNTEYLFHPFCETRTVGEMLTFHTGERRDAMLTYVVDLYAGDLEAHPDAVAPEAAWLDRSGYYALARPDPAHHNHPKERQLDFFGGLRWRYEEHVPPERRRIDRISLFRARPGLVLRPDHTFNVEEYNTYACKWHNNLTAAVCSFRVAKALKRNPGSTYEIETFRWHNSEPFEWQSRQLLDLGLMEPGQWF
ncbi:hypothetical protein OB2597_14751 [Pseudooceanicola batsensis HTCC2597]|uniref:Uncharacterized protein n=1 Tax=Pseudooceanicola batsensis (strain ATCC BAA-863 / DSM 15984 / KCTC 12145 / HTCC2597) TaxID=252305 RepID=A3U2B2_PSEBH|nr:hypothetical protein [Pseudooceanicola batsensis]EAQ01712.1 hypothetical protein OB2597_14751 [Pseudooceanicola batsensis HTCC2597]